MTPEPISAKAVLKVAEDFERSANGTNEPCFWGQFQTSLACLINQEKS
jgi:hypothetical protein